MSLVLLWMPNDTLYHFLAKHDDRLHRGHRLQFVCPLTPTASRSSDPTVIAVGYCQWVALLWVACVIIEINENNPSQCILSLSSMVSDLHASD